MWGASSSSSMLMRRVVVSSLLLSFAARALDVPKKVVLAGFSKARARELSECCSALDLETARYSGGGGGSADWLVWSAEEDDGGAVGWARRESVAMIIADAKENALPEAAISLRSRAEGGDFVQVDGVDSINFRLGGVTGVVAYSEEVVKIRSSDARLRKKSEKWCTASMLASFADHADVLKDDGFLLRVVMPKDQRRQLVAGMVLAAAALSTKVALQSQLELDELLRTEQAPFVARCELEAPGAGVPKKKPDRKRAINDGDEDAADEELLRDIEEDPNFMRYDYWSSQKQEGM